VIEQLERIQIEQNLGLTFTDWNMVTTAFMHKSYLNENRLDGRAEDWDRLYFLGQELFYLVLADLGFRYISQDRPFLSQLNDDLVTNNLRHRILDHYNCFRFVRRGKGAGADNLKAESLLIPILSVIYLEHGYETVSKWVKPVYLQLVKEYQETPNIDWKSSLQEWVQTKKQTVKYRVIEEEGPAHEKWFVVEANALDKKVEGKGRRKKDAEQAAAKQFHIKFIPKSIWNKSFALKKHKYPVFNLSIKREKELKTFSRYFNSRPELLHQALSHISFFHENRRYQKLDYSPLAYLGSRVYGFVYTKLLYKHFYNLQIKSIKNATLIAAYLRSNSETVDFINSLNLNIENLIWVGNGQRKAGITDSISVDVFQALFGAHFIDTQISESRVSIEKLEKMIEPHLYKMINKYNEEEFSPTTTLQELIQGISTGWEVIFESKPLRHTHNPENLGIVQINYKGKEVIQWQEKSVSGSEAKNMAAKKAIHEIKSALNLLQGDESSHFSKEIKPIVKSFYTALMRQRTPTKKIKRLVEQCGGLGVKHIIHNRFVDGYRDIIESILHSKSKGVIIDKKLLINAYNAYKPDFKLNQINFSHMTEYIQDLTNWLQDLDLNSNPIHVDRFFDDVVESIQVFRHIVDEDMHIMSLGTSIEELMFVKPRGIDIKLLVENQKNIYGNDSFLKWFFYNVLTKLEACRLDDTLILSTSIHVQQSTISSSCTNVFLYFNSDDVNSEELHSSLKHLVQFASLCFVQTELKESQIQFSFVNPFGGLEPNIQKEVTGLFEWISSMQMQHIKELSPIGGIIHDLKNTLVLLKHHLVISKKNNKMNKDFFSIQDSCLSKVNALRTFFSINSANLSHVNLLDFSSILSKELKTLANNRCDFRFAINIETHEIITDSSLLHSIITNLVKNAFESVNEANGRVKLSLIMDYEDELLVKIEDNGSGIKPDQLKRLFTSFHTNKKNIKGTGLGLPTVKRYVDILGGMIEVSSVVNKGTTFELLIPLEGIEFTVAG
jgi:ribonuclease III